MKLSIVIVNYNVKYFLEQCLLSVKKAIQQMELSNPAFSSEIFVVDNNSVDSSATMLKTKFPSVISIFNKKNVGFSVANNQAIKIAKGEYILLLNPDTVVNEDSFQKIIDFMDKNPKAGALGVKMIDGSGNFLPESKRGFPSPRIAFHKISGLSKLFPKSKKFGQYHLGYLDNNSINEVDVLSGAFFLLRKETLEKVGLLDEGFFMYGEDIDLSYRIQLAGYKNFYFPETQIIHYKGESTKNGSLNYVFLFYKAMIIFAKKHFSKKNASLFSFFINIAIYLRAGVSIVHRFFNRSIFFLSDFSLIFGGLLLVKIFWESNSKVGHGIPYPREFLIYILPLYSLLWTLGLFFVKNYSRPFKISKILKGVLLGTILISSFYAFFEESFRFSRAIIILGTLSTFFASVITRIMYNLIVDKSFNLWFSNETKIAVVGSKEENKRVLQLLNRSPLNFKYAGYISPPNQESNDKSNLGTINKLNEIIHVFNIRELIFCSKDITSSAIIEIMTKVEKKDVIFKIAPPESLFVIGSNDKNNSGDYYTIDIELSISKTENKTNKRMMDIFVSLFFLIFYTVFVWFQNSKIGFIKNIFSVLIGNKSWVGYIDNEENSQLPKIRKGVLSSAVTFKRKELEEKRIKQLNLIYAKDYSVFTDVKIMKDGIRMLGN